MDVYPDRKTLARQLELLERKQDRPEAELAVAPSADNVALHPQAPRCYRAKVAEIHTALNQIDKAARSAINTLRELIDHIVIIPTAEPAPVGMQVIGNLAAFLVSNGEGTEITVKMVAAARSHLYRTSVRIPNLPRGGGRVRSQRD